MAEIRYRRLETSFCSKETDSALLLTHTVSKSNNMHVCCQGDDENV